MLRITTTTTESEQTWILEGQLAGPWAEELRSTWEQAGDSRRGQKRLVDLTGVTFVDDGGRTVLCAMRKAGFRFLGRGVDTKHLIGDLKRESESPLRRCLAWWSCDANSRKETGK